MTMGTHCLSDMINDIEAYAIDTVASAKGVTELLQDLRARIEDARVVNEALLDQLSKAGARIARLEAVMVEGRNFERAYAADIGYVANKGVVDAWIRFTLALGAAERAEEKDGE